MNVVGHHLQGDDLASLFVCNILDDLLQPRLELPNQKFPSVFWTPNNVVIDQMNTLVASVVFHCVCFVFTDINMQQFLKNQHF